MRWVGERAGSKSLSCNGLISSSPVCQCVHCSQHAGSVPCPSACLGNSCWSYLSPEESDINTQYEISLTLDKEGFQRTAMNIKQHKYFLGEILASPLTVRALIQTVRKQQRGERFAKVLTVRQSGRKALVTVQEADLSNQRSLEISTKYFSIVCRRATSSCSLITVCWKGLCSRLCELYYSRQPLIKEQCCSLPLPFLCSLVSYKLLLLVCVASMIAGNFASHTTRTSSEWGSPSILQADRPRKTAQQSSETWSAFLCWLMAG